MLKRSPDAIPTRYQTPVLSDRFWAVGVFLLAPLMGIASVLAAMRLSAKMTDPQSANQFTGLVIVPTLGLASESSENY